MGLKLIFFTCAIMIIIGCILFLSTLETMKESSEYMEKERNRLLNQHSDAMQSNVQFDDTNIYFDL